MSQRPATSCEAAERILHAAETLFAEKGFDAVSMTAIAGRAGVSKANIFHHFESKHALYLSVLRAACQESSQLLEDMGQRPGDILERLGHFIECHLNNIRAHGTTSRLVLREILEDDAARGQELAEKVIDENFSRLVGILREGQKRGELRNDVDPAIAATVLVGANVFFFQAATVLRHLSDVSFADDPERYSRALTDILLNGLSSSIPGAEPQSTEQTQSREEP